MAALRRAMSLAEDSTPATLKTLKKPVPLLAKNSDFASAIGSYDYNLRALLQITLLISRVLGYLTSVSFTVHIVAQMIS